MGRGPDTEIVPLAHSLEKLLLPSLSAKDPADWNRHARHLDVISTLIARFEGLWLGLEGSCTVQAVMHVRQEFELRGHHHSFFAPAGLGIIALLLMLLLLPLLRCAMKVMRYVMAHYSFPRQYAPALAFQQTNRRPRWATV